MIKLNAPAFASEAKEAKWWFDHNEEMTDHFEQALENGTLTQGTTLRRVGLRSTTLLLKEQDAELADAQAAERGLDAKVYLQTLLHQALLKASEQS